MQIPALLQLSWAGLGVLLFAWAISSGSTKPKKPQYRDMLAAIIMAHGVLIPFILNNHTDLAAATHPYNYHIAFFISLLLIWCLRKKRAVLTVLAVVWVFTRFFIINDFSFLREHPFLQGNQQVQQGIATVNSFSSSRQTFLYIPESPLLGTVIITPDDNLWHSSIRLRPFILSPAVGTGFSFLSATGDKLIFAFSETGNLIQFDDTENAYRHCRATVINAKPYDPGLQASIDKIANIYPRDRNRALAILWKVAADQYSDLPIIYREYYATPGNAAFIDAYRDFINELEKLHTLTCDTYSSNVSEITAAQCRDIKLIMEREFGMLNAVQ